GLRWRRTSWVHARRSRWGLSLSRATTAAKSHWASNIQPSAVSLYLGKYIVSRQLGNSRFLGRIRCVSHSPARAAEDYNNGHSCGIAALRRHKRPSIRTSNGPNRAQLFRFRLELDDGPATVRFVTL